MWAVCTVTPLPNCLDLASCSSARGAHAQLQHFDFWAASLLLLPTPNLSPEFT